MVKLHIKKSNNLYFEIEGVNVKSVCIVKPINHKAKVATNKKSGGSGVVRP